MWLLCKVGGSIIASGLLWLQLLLSKCINEVFFFPHSCFAINPFELILKSLQLFWLVYKTQTHHYLNESFACRQPDCLHSFPSCIKALHSIPAELRSTHVQLFISLCQEFSLASTCQYPPQIGRQAHIWHMVQSSAAFPPLFSWPASTPEEHGNTCCTLANRHTFTVANTHTNTDDATYLSVLYVRPPYPLSCWAFVHKLFETGFRVFNSSTVSGATAKSPE